MNFFRLDLFRTLTRQTEQPVGTITFKYKSAQRRFVDRVLWDRLRQESPVYSGDFIRTAELSEASITFPDGAVIDLAENTLVQVHAEPGAARLDINEGEFSVLAGGGLVIASGENRVVVEPGAALSAGVDSGAFRLRVTEGSAAVTGNGETRTVAAGELASFGLDAAPEGGAGAVREAAALSPPPAARFLNPGGTLPIAFRWRRVNLDPEDLVRLELAEDRDFARIVFQEDLAGEETAADLAAGSYYWRVFPAPRGDEAAAPPPLGTFALKVIAAPAPLLISPAAGYQYQYRVRQPSVRFQWAEVAGAAFYLLEAADNPGMANPALAREVRGGTMLYSSDLGPGTWYWRVRAVFPGDYQGTAGQGNPSSFIITRSGELGVPELQSPADRGMVNIAAGRGDLYFSWRTEPEARSYTIRISENPDLSAPLITGTVRDNFYVYRAGETVMGPGQYYWGVLQTDIEGNPSDFSPPRGFTALEGEMIQRTVFPPEGYTIGTTMMPDIRFTWKSNLPMQTWFQVSGEADFSQPVLDEVVSGETFPGRTLPEGVWYWRIQARSPGGMVFETPPKRFTTAPPLAAPVLLGPGMNERVVIEEGEPLGFSWEESPGAEYYQFKLYRGEDRSRAVYEDSLVEGRTLSLPSDDLPEGSYYWTLQGFAPESSRSTRRTGLLSGGAFAFRKLRPVLLGFPEDGAVFEGLRAYFEPGTAQWLSSDPAALSRFIISRNREMAGPPVLAIDQPPEAVVLPRLREGDYYWTVRAETADGFNISAKTPRLFRVLPIPPLPAATDRLPQDGTVITGADLRQSRTISFAWNPVPGAGAYIFTLSREGESSPLIRRGPQAETAFVLEDLSLLDLGTFIWQVEAVLTDREEILQRGEIGENRIRIDFALPAKPELVQPGTLYGRE